MSLRTLCGSLPTDGAESKNDRWLVYMHHSHAPVASRMVLHVRLGRVALGDVIGGLATTTATTPGQRMCLIKDGGIMTFLCKRVALRGCSQSC